MKLRINYPEIPVLAVAFTRGNDPMGFLIALIRGGCKAAFDLNFPTHAFVVTEDHMQLFATEETMFGLQEDSLEIYNKSKNRIVDMYFWKQWDSLMHFPKFIPHEATRKYSESISQEEPRQYPEILRKEAAQIFLSRIRRLRKESSKYDFIGLLTFLHIFGKLFKPSKYRQWCSENCAKLLKHFGAGFITETHIAPDELLDAMIGSPECIKISNFYK
jgi:hypothetical protein